VNDLLRIGSRGSALALVQSRWVRDELLRRNPGLRVEISVIHTKGDKLLEAPLSMIGDKGLFVKELEAALLDGRADVAVHSAKDMPTAVSDRLTLGAITERVDVRDVFVARGTPDPSEEPSGERSPIPPRVLADVPNGAVVGSSSLRRRAQLLALRPDLRLVDIRGNVQTRLLKVEEQGMAGTILAAAGLARLDLTAEVAFAFSFDEMLPAVGQGALAIEARRGDERVLNLIAPLAHRWSGQAVRAERSLMRVLGGGCQVPIAGLAQPVPGGGGEEGSHLRLRAFVGSLDGRDCLRDELTWPAGDPERLGEALAGRLLDSGAERILAGLRGQG
jgi:hydroxymethylbilane synthase